MISAGICPLIAPIVGSLATSIGGDLAGASGIEKILGGIFGPNKQDDGSQDMATQLSQAKLQQQKQANEPTSMAQLWRDKFNQARYGGM